MQIATLNNPGLGSNSLKVNVKLIKHFVEKNRANHKKDKMHSFTESICIAPLPGGHPEAFSSQEQHCQMKPFHVNEECLIGVLDGERSAKERPFLWRL